MFLKLTLPPRVSLSPSREMSKGTKRASPGAEEEKNPLSSVELSDEDAKNLTQIQRDLARAELILGELSRWCIGFL